MPLDPGQVLNYRYRIDSQLGQGGMGAVYRAWDLNLNIQVAIKENLDASTKARKQFSREAQILAHLHHPNLPRVTDYFFIAGQGQYLVMDFVEGEDLQSMLDRLGPLPEPQVLIWIAQVCDALSYLHNQPSPIIHRDIKPANIKIRSDGRVMLVDFGIAKIYDPQFATVVGARAVTRGYSPPEQYGDGTTDTRSDIYALGATLYHLLTGQIPPESVQRMVSGIALPPPRELNDQISPKIEQTILRAIEVATDSRFQSVGELRAALAQASDGAVPLPATPTTSPPYPQSPDGLTVELPPARQISPIWLGVLAGLGLASLWVVLTFSGVFNGFGAPKGISQTQTRVALGLTQTALAALANTHVTLAASLTPTATRTPTATLVPPTPTATPVPPTLAPTDTPVPPTPTLQPTPIPVVLPQPIAPPGGGGPYRNPITFRWRGSLSEGQAYQVAVILVKFPQSIVTSPLLTTPSWTTNLSDSLGTQEYRWRVAVISEGKVVATSAEWTFWHSPIGNPQPP